MTFSSLDNSRKQFGLVNTLILQLSDMAIYGDVSCFMVLSILSNDHFYIVG